GVARRVADRAQADLDQIGRGRWSRHGRGVAGACSQRIHDVDSLRCAWPRDHSAPFLAPPQLASRIDSRPCPAFATRSRTVDLAEARGAAWRETGGFVNLTRWSMLREDTIQRWKCQQQSPFADAAERIGRNRPRPRTPTPREDELPGFHSTAH